MPRLLSRYGIYLLLNSTVLILALMHTPDLFNRPSTPFNIEFSTDKLIVSDLKNKDACPELRPGDRVLSWDSITLRKPIDIDFLADLGKIGESVNLTFERQNKQFDTQIHLISYYSSPRNIIVILFVGLITCIFGVIILLYGPDTIAKTVLHWTITGLGLSVMLTTGSLYQSNTLTYVIEFLFHIYYTITIGGFLFFAILFPWPRTRHIKRTAALIFAPLILITLALIWYRFHAIALTSLEDLRIFALLFDIFHLLIFVCIGGGILFFIHTYRISDKTNEKSQSRWILWGVTIGSFPFLLLSIMPQFFGITELIAEEYTVIFFLVIPFSFTMAIVRYRLLNIDLLISRTLVYGILTLFIGSAYFLMIFLIISAIGGAFIFEEYFTILLITLLVTVFFNPLRIRVQRLVDNYLFTAREQYRNAVRKINRELGSVYNTADLFQLLVNCLSAYIPAEKIAFYSFANGNLDLAAANTDQVEGTVPITKREAAVLSKSIKIFALPGLVTISDSGDISDLDHLFDHLKLSLAIPILTDSVKLYGLLACSPSHQKDHFIEEEADLMLTAVSQVTQNLKRLLLQERIIQEREEKKRLKAINDLMSFYVSSVSHELKSPLSAIQLHTDILASTKNISNTQQNEHLDIIKGEGERLQRLIENVLDISKIERGVRSYHFSRQNVNQVINQALKVMQYQINLYKVRVVKKLAGHLPDIIADAEALEQALINLIDNAIKYSSEEDRFIEIRSEHLNGEISICVRDNGIGIDQKEVKIIFSRFMRGNDPRVHSVGGAGIGLTIVQHVTEAHQGHVELASEPGKGSKICLILPVLSEKNQM